MLLSSLPCPVIWGGILRQTRFCQYPGVGFPWTTEWPVHVPDMLIRNRSVRIGLKMACARAPHSRANSREGVTVPALSSSGEYVPGHRQGGIIGGSQSNV